MSQYCHVSRQIDDYLDEQDRLESEEAAMEAARVDARNVVADAIRSARSKAGAGPQHHESVRQLSSQAWRNYIAAEARDFVEPFDPNP